MIINKDPYKVLGIIPGMSEANIKSRYRQLCRMYHPDNTETGDASKFKEINDAWKVLQIVGTQSTVKIQRRWTHNNLFDIRKV